MYKLLARPGFEKGRNVPNHHIYLQLNELPDEELKKIGRERSGWVQEAMKRDAERLRGCQLYGWPVADRLSRGLCHRRNAPGFQGTARCGCCP